MERMLIAGGMTGAAIKPTRIIALGRGRRAVIPPRSVEAEYRAHDPVVMTLPIDPKLATLNIVVTMRTSFTPLRLPEQLKRGAKSTRVSSAHRAGESVLAHRVR